MVFVVPPVLHTKPEVQLAAVRVTDVPGQVLVLDAESVGVVAGETTICWLAVPAQVPVPQVAV
jgi:hypothetical protein